MPADHTEMTLRLLQRMFGELCAIRWADSPKKIKAVATGLPITPYVEQVISTINDVLGSNVTSDLSAVHNLLDYVVSNILNSQSDQDMVTYVFLHELMELTSFTYENEPVSVGLLITLDEASNRLRSHLDALGIDFHSMVTGRDFNEDFLRTSKQTYILTDGRVAAYVVNPRGKILGLAKKRPGMGSIQQQVLAPIASSRDAIIPELVVSGVLRDMLLDLYQNHGPSAFSPLGADGLLSNAYHDELLKKFLAEPPRIMFGMVSHGRIRFHMGRLTYFQWQGGRWRFQDGTATETLFVNLLVRGELDKGNPAPVVDLYDSLVQQNIGRSAIVAESGASRDDSTERLVPLLEQLIADGDSFSGKWMLYAAYKRFRWTLRDLLRSYAIDDPETFSALATTAEGLSYPGPETMTWADIKMYGNHLYEVAQDLSDNKIGALLVVVDSSTISEVMGNCLVPESPIHSILLTNHNAERYKLWSVDRFHVRALCHVDGAVILRDDGTVEDFGVMIRNRVDSSDIGEEGARTLAARSISLVPGVRFAIKVSEDGPITLFVRGEKFTGGLG